MASYGDDQEGTKPSIRTGEDHPKPSNSDLFSSAKLLADAARSQFGGGGEEKKKYDNAQLAGAAADVLGAAGEYGKLDESKGLGKYLDQAEDYLHKYGSSQSATSKPDQPAIEKPEGGGSGGGFGDYMKVAEGFLNKKESGEGEGKSGGGFGDYMKVAEGLLQKNEPEEGEKGNSGGGIGDYVKVAEGLLNKDSGEGEKADGSSGGGYGDFMKMAGGFLKK